MLNSKPEIHFRAFRIPFVSEEIFPSVNFHIRFGEKLILSNPSGTGKSSLLKALMGWCNYQGEILLNNQTLTNGNLSQIRSACSYLGQEPISDEFSVSEYFNLIHNFGQNRELQLNETILTDVLSMWDLPSSYATKSIKILSGGEKTRIGLALVHWLNRPVVLLDEPTAALDDSLKEQVIDWVLKSQQTFIIASHDKNWQREGFRVIKNWTDANL